MAEPRMQPDSLAPSASNLSGTTVGRFAILELLGKGGMGEVYRANDLRLKRSVALKRISPALRDDPRSRQRLWKEAEWACRLSDPHIAAVYDVIEEENELFIVMEYVEGQTLRRRLGQPLSVPDFLSVAAQCAEALAAAHKAGLVHRDIKPENIMLSPLGQVKILDFGLARNLPAAADTITMTPRAQPEFAGTLMYMAPEILQDKECDARSDIFSLGIVFYETLAGRNPFFADGFLAVCHRIAHEDPLPLRELNSRVPPELERIVGKMLAKNPAERYSSAADLAVDLKVLRRSSEHPRIAPAPRAEVPVRFPGRRLVVAGLALLACIAASIIVYRRLHAAVLAPHASVLLADFDNLTREKLFDNTVTEAMRQALVQSRYVRLVPRAQVAEAAARMGRADISRLDAGLAREICRRENYAALLTGRITPSDGKFSLTVQVLDPREGAPLLTQAATLRSPAELYGAADGLAKSLRNRLGESLAQVEQNTQPLAKVTTPSLEALQRYSRAMEFYGTADFESSFSLARSAVELDPDFAMAHLYEAKVYAGRGDLQSATAEMALARKNLDRVTERERYIILAADYEFQGLYEKAAEQYRLLTEVYPDDLDGYRGLAESSVWAGRAEEGLAAQKHALQLNPNSARDHGVLISYLNRLNRFDEALADYHAAQAKGIKSPRMHWDVGLAYLGQGNTSVARQEFELLRKEGGAYEESLATLCFARVLMYEGRLREATEALHSGIVLGEKLHSATWIPVQRYLLAQALLARGQLHQARAEVRRLEQVASSPPLEHELRRGGLLAVELGILPTARLLLARLAALNAQRDSGYTKSCYYNLKGAIDLASGDAESAIESQRRAAVFFLSYKIPAALGNAYAARGEWRSATESYRRYLEFKGEILSNDSPAEWVLAHLVLARALAKAGETTLALQSYDDFLRLWTHADQGLPALREARAERADLLATAEAVRTKPNSGQR